MPHCSGTDFKQSIKKTLLKIEGKDETTFAHFSYSLRISRLSSNIVMLNEASMLNEVT